MGWQVIVAMVVMIPVILLPVAFIWYLNFGGIYTAIREARAARAARKQSKRVLAEARQYVDK